ncbi:hypothetical protein [Vibrio mediterranei]|jgi:hypothetical protein|uniref:hypothetical protein n=1 Tax=Vibrio mediterranei TaxID=689 RepID=UPI00148D6E6A|nr:hypothetical protein [Vibrio mediterranei]NOI26667.1 hypothetical protein [Vibrio mediterranei]
MSDGIEIPAKLFSYGGGEEEPIDIDAYLNRGGLITIRIDEDNWIELSPISAKKLLKKIDYAVGQSLAEYLSSQE